MRYAICLLILLSATLVFSETKTSAVKKFFSPLPLPDGALREPIPDRGPEQPVPVPDLASLKWEWRPTVTLPAFKIVESTREDSNIDVFVLSSVGGGISYQKLKFDDETQRWKSIFSWSPLTVLLAGNLNDPDTSLDLSLATTLGFVNNLFMIGAGYDFGRVEDRSRFFGLLSVGINFNN